MTPAGEVAGNDVDDEEGPAATPGHIPQDNRRPVARRSHARGSPPYTANSPESRKARALPGSATPRKVLAAEPDARRGVPSHVSGALIYGRGRCRPRFGSQDEAPTASRTCRLTDQTRGDGGRTRPGATADGSDARQRPTVDAVRGCRRFPITASTDWYAPIRPGGTRGVAPPRQIHAQSWAPSGVARADPAPRRQIHCLPVRGHGFGKSGGRRAPAGGR